MALFRISMVAYHENVSEIIIEKHRKSDPTAALNPVEARKLRAVIGSLQWLVAQCRFDMGFHVSVIQGESPPTIGTLIRANALVREFKRHGNFELVFRPVDFRKAGIVVVSDAALGNVAVCGSNQGDVVEKTYSQACYFVLVAEQSLLQGE